MDRPLLHFPSDFSTFSYYLLLNNNISRLSECLYLTFFINPFRQILQGKKVGACLKLSQTTKMGPFVKRVNSWKSLTIFANISILDIWPGCEYASEPELVFPMQLHEKCPYSEFFWSIFLRILTEYGETRSISPYSVQIWENTDQKNSEYGHFSHKVTINTLVHKVQNGHTNLGNHAANTERLLKCV